MTLLFALCAAVLLALIMIALLRPLFRPPAADPDRKNVSVTVFRDQLAEIDRDLAAGLLDATEAASAKIELERRLLSVAGGKTDTTIASSSSRPSWLAGGAVAVLVPLIAVPLYFFLGAPSLPDQPLAARAQERALMSADGGLDLDKARVALEAKLKQAPDSLEGWILLARTDTALGRPTDAGRAFDKALALSNRRSDILEAYGEALVSAAQGTVPPEARALFEEAVKASPTAYSARYGLALGRAQDGDLTGALADWRKLEQDAPKDADWVPTVRQAITAAEQQLAGDQSGGTQASAPNPQGKGAEMAAIAGLPPTEQLDAIKGMVAGLAARLARNPDDLAGWTRLGRSYLVLGQPDKAADAYGKATALAPKDPDLALSLAQAFRAASGDSPILSDKTVQAYTKVNVLAADEPEALFYLGLAAKQHGDVAAAKAHWHHLLGLLSPDSDQAREVTKQLADLGNSG